MKTQTFYLKEVKLKSRLKHILLFLTLASIGFSQPSVQQSVQTRQYTIDYTSVNPSREDIQELIRRFNYTVNYWNDEAANEGGAGSSRRFFKKWINPGVDALLKFGGPLSSLSGLRDWADERLYGENARNYQRERDFQVRQTFEDTATKIVNEYCHGDIQCTEMVFDRMLENEEVRRQLSEANALGAFDEAQTRAYAKLAAEKAQAQYEGTIISIANLEETVLAAIASTNSILLQGFHQVNENQKRIIRNTAAILQIQQEHTIALQHIQNTLDANFEMIHQGIGDIIGLQQVNLYLSGIMIDGLVQLDQKIDHLTMDVADIRATQINDIFNNSPIDQKIALLLDPNSAINQYLDVDQRTALLDDLKAIKLRQDIANTAAIVSRWGQVGLEAINTFCQSCPGELSQAISIGIGLADIVGNIASGNIAGAVMSALGLFGDPGPSPEMQMLMQISEQLQDLERNMNAQFQAVHEHLFALEENLTKRLEIIDLKINQIAEVIFMMREEILVGLSGIDAQLNYVINQNECIKDLILTLTNQQNQDMCKVPSMDFILALLENRIESYQDLDNFYRGSSFGSCLQTLFDVSNVSLPEVAFFRYGQCNVEGQDNKARADRMYEYLYHELYGYLLEDTLMTKALMIFPNTVTALDSVADFVENESTASPIHLLQEDRFYKNYKAVITFSNYVLSLFPFLELYDDGQLKTPDEINENPGFSRERSQKMISILRATSDLLSRTYLQQSMMAGNASMELIDQFIADYQYSGELEQGDVFFSLPDLFAHNPFIRKNYAAYLLDRAVGYDRLAQIVQYKLFDEYPYRIIYEGYNILLTYDANENPVFIVTLNNANKPAENIELFRSYLPVIDGVVDAETYTQSLQFSYPASIPELEMTINRVNEKLGEMYMVTDPALDTEGTDFSRGDLNYLIQQMRQDNQNQ